MFKCFCEIFLSSLVIRVIQIELISSADIVQKSEVVFSISLIKGEQLHPVYSKITHVDILPSFIKPPNLILPIFSFQSLMDIIGYFQLIFGLGEYFFCYFIIILPTELNLKKAVKNRLFMLFFFNFIEQFDQNLQYLVDALYGPGESWVF